MRRRIFITGPLVVLLALAGCAAPTDPDSSTPAPQTTSPSAAVPTPTNGSTSPTPSAAAAQGTVVQFTSGDTTVEVTIAADNPTARDFLSMLPLTVSVEEFAGREKIANLPRALETAGSPGSDPENGDLIYFIPWGNIGFYYNTDGIGYSDQTIHLGTYKATPEQLSSLEGRNVTVKIVK